MNRQFEQTTMLNMGRERTLKQVRKEDHKMAWRLEEYGFEAIGEI